MMGKHPQLGLAWSRGPIRQESAQQPTLSYSEDFRGLFHPLIDFEAFSFIIDVKFNSQIFICSYLLCSMKAFFVWSRCLHMLDFSFNCYIILNVKVKLILASQLIDAKSLAGLTSIR